MKSPKISVVIPSYNKIKFIGKTLNSVVSQKYPNLEVIIQDGGSTDGTLEIIKKYARKYPAIIKWESKKDNGQLDAINNGLSIATGDILAFINADDLYTRNSFISISRSYQKNPNALWFAGKGIVIDEAGHEIAKPITWYKNLFLLLNRKSLILIFNYLMQPSVFLTRKAYEKYGPFTGTKDFITEYDMWLTLSKAQMPVIIKKNLSRFRIEPSTKTKRMFRSMILEDRKIVGKNTENPLIIFLHDVHNYGRELIGGFI